jgi:hypothetical protein
MSTCGYFGTLLRVGCNYFEGRGRASLSVTILEGEGASPGVTTLGERGRRQCNYFEGRGGVARCNYFEGRGGAQT